MTTRALARKVAALARKGGPLEEGVVMALILLLLLVGLGLIW